MARRATSGRPSKLQLAFETIVGAVQKQVESTMGNVADFVIPLAVTLFFFILVSNWLELIPSGGYLESPSADINMTLALALLVLVVAVGRDGELRDGLPAGRVAHLGITAEVADDHALVE